MERIPAGRGRDGQLSFRVRAAESVLAVGVSLGLGERECDNAGARTKLWGISESANYRAFPT